MSGRRVSYTVSVRATDGYSPAGDVRLELQLPSGFRSDVVSQSCHRAGRSAVRCHTNEISSTYNYIVAIDGHFVAGARPGARLFAATVRTGNRNIGNRRAVARVSLRPQSARQDLAPRAARAFWFC